MKTEGGEEVKLRVFLTSTIDGGQWSPLCMSPSTHCIGGWVIPVWTLILQGSSYMIHFNIILPATSNYSNDVDM
jgi:hypothetical protein